MSPDTTTEPAPTELGPTGTTRLSVLVTGLPVAGPRDFVGVRPTLRLPYRDETGSGTFELSLVAGDGAVPSPSGDRAHDAARGPLVGAVVVAAAGRLTDCRPLVTELGSRGLPFVVVVDVAEGGPRVPATIARRALHLAATVPVLTGDCRDRGLVPPVLTALTERALHLLEGELDGDQPLVRQSVAG